MIDAYNRKQILLAIVNAAAGMFALGIAIAFFHFAFHMILDSFGLDNRKAFVLGLTALSLAVLFVSGWRAHRVGAGHYAYHQSGFFVDLDPVTGGAAAVDRYAHQVTGPAHALTQILLVAPLQLLKSVDRIRAKIPPDDGLEKRLEHLLATINEKDAWQPIVSFEDQSAELGCLIRMDAIQFSPSRAVVRPK